MDRRSSRLIMTAVLIAVVAIAAAALIWGG